MEQIKTRFIQQENTRGRKEVYMQELHISVRNLVEFIFRAGDIDNRAGKLASAEASKENPPLFCCFFIRKPENSKKHGHLLPGGSTAEN